MILTNQIRDDVYRSCTPVQKYLYSHAENGQKLYTLAGKYNVKTEEVYTKFATTVGDIILGFYRIEDTVPLLQQELGIDAKAAALLGANVLDFLAPLSDPNWQLPEEESANGDDDEAQPLPNQLDHVQVNDPIPEARGTTTSSPYDRDSADTMMTDPSKDNSLHFEPVHVSPSQDSLRRPLSDLPSYADPAPKPVQDPASIEEPPRWTHS